MTFYQKNTWLLKSRLQRRYHWENVFFLDRHTRMFVEYKERFNFVTRHYFKEVTKEVLNLHSNFSVFIQYQPSKRIIPTWKKVLVFYLRYYNVFKLFQQKRLFLLVIFLTEINIKHVGIKYVYKNNFNQNILKTVLSYCT